MSVQLALAWIRNCLVTASPHPSSCPQAIQPGTQAMPLPSASLRHFLGGLTEEEALTNALTASLAEDSSGEEEGGPATRDEAAMPQSGISFAKMTAMGFAATGRQHTLCPMQERMQQAACCLLQALTDHEDLAAKARCQHLQRTQTVREWLVTRKQLVSSVCVVGPSLPASSPGGMSGTSPGALQRPAWGKALAAHPTQPLSTPGVKLQAWGITSQKQLTPGTAMPVAPAPISWLEPSALSAHSQVSVGHFHHSPSGCP